MIKQGLQETWLPLGDPLYVGVGGRRQRVGNNIFLSSDAVSNTNTLCVLIQGSGAVRAGMWARALCINEDLSLGSVLPYIDYAKEQKWAVAVLNPNLTAVTVRDLGNSDDFLITQGKTDDDKQQETKEKKTEDTKMLSAEESSKDRQASLDYFCSISKSSPWPVKNIKIKGNETPRDHTLYVWDNFLAKAKAKNIVIVAHSAGGDCTMHLLKQRGKDVLPKLRAVAFTDSVHSVASSDPAEVKSFIRSHAINFVTSELPLGTAIKRDPRSKDGCPCVSAGHEKHEFTSGTARTAVFKFLSDALKKS